MQRRLDITVRQFNTMIDVLKKVKRLGKKFIVLNDTIMVTDNIVIGKHYVENSIIPDVQIPYECADVTLLVSQLDSIKGKKTELYLEYNPTTISITVNSFTYVIATVIDSLEQEVPEYSTLANTNHEWTTIPRSDLELIKKNSTILIRQGGLNVRVAKSLFPEFGTGKDIKFRMTYRFEDINRHEVGKFVVETKFDFMRMIHAYYFVKYSNEE